MCMCVYHACAEVDRGGQMALKILKLGLGMLVNCYVGFKNGA